MAHVGGAPYRGRTHTRARGGAATWPPRPPRARDSRCVVTRGATDDVARFAPCVLVGARASWGAHVSRDQFADLYVEADDLVAGRRVRPSWRARRQRRRDARVSNVIQHAIGWVAELRSQPEPPSKASRPRCGARCRTRGGAPCVARVCVRPDGYGLAKRCRLHGGLSTGPRTPEGKRRALEALARGRAKRGRCPP